jgi:DNA polymerase III alpha subunit
MGLGAIQGDTRRRDSAAVGTTWFPLEQPPADVAAPLRPVPFYDPLVYVVESYRLGLKFLPPTVNEPGPEFAVHRDAIRVPLTRTKGLSERTIKRLLAERERGVFVSLSDFHHRVNPLPEELEAMIRVGGFDEFGQTRTRQFWEAQRLAKADRRWSKAESGV